MGETMITFPAVRDPGSIELLFRNIRTHDKPDKITTDYLASIGFRRQPDVKLLELLFFLGFIDSNLSPTEQWDAVKEVSDGEFKSVLSPAIQKAYLKVFQYQSEQQSTDSKVLMAFFKKETGVSDTESAYMVMTLQVLLDLADLQASVAEKEEEEAPAVPAPAEKEPVPVPQPALPVVSDEPAPGIDELASGVSLNITIPAEAMDSELRELIKTLLRKTLQDN
ncbi:hypothetical protein DRQ21_03020 [Candidatus Fermentibacteria bacterium]|nr:MAG: hypothetical protein DRQ21_03020 [Candidatus Fermentibacteria bacterium]